MKLFRLLPILLFLTEGFASTPVTEFMFMQRVTTMKRSGKPPIAEQLPATIGIAPPARDTAPQPYANTSQLETLYKERLNTPSSQPATPENAPPASAPPAAGTPPASQPLAPPPPPAPVARIELAFSNAPIDQVINTIMRELGYAYVIDPQVTGSVTLFTPPGMGIPRNKLFEVFEQILKMNGQAIVKQKDLYFIVPINQSPKIPHQILVKPEVESKPGGNKNNKKAAPKPNREEPKEQSPPNETPPPNQTASLGLGIPVGGGTAFLAALQQPEQQQPAPTVLAVPETAEAAQLEGEQGVITYIIPLHYIPSDQMVEMIKPFVSDGATVINFASANMLIITDYRKNIQQVLNLISILDTQYFSINTVDLIPVQYNQVEDVAEDLGQIFAPGDKAGGVRIVAIPRLNSVLVVTHAPSVLRQVKEWVDKLDTPSASTNIKTFVYQVENNTAVNIAEVLAQLYEDGFGLPSAPTGETREERPGGATPAQQQQQAPITSREAGFLPPGETGAQRGIRSQLGPNLTGRPMTSQPTVRAVVAGNVKIIVNEFNNSLIVQATEADYQFLLQTIKQLDVLPRQVLLEAKIYSVELRDDLSFGVSAFLEQRGTEREIPDPKDATKTIKVPLGPPTTGELKSGEITTSTRILVGMSRQLEALINALRSKTKVEILEAPRLLAMDGMQATFNVGAEVPVTTASFGDPLRSGAAGSFINSIQFRPTGTTLLIFPRISASGIVTMDLAIEISSATGAALTPTINRNYVETSLIVRDGQTIAIAGIISDQFNLQKDRVPLLGDIPILGVLFGNTTRSTRRSELIFFITPRVIRNLPTATELTLNFKRALRESYGFINRRETTEQELIRERTEKELKQELKQQEELQKELKEQQEKNEP